MENSSEQVRNEISILNNNTHFENIQISQMVKVARKNNL